MAAVINLFSRRVVGWSMNAAMTAQLVADALMMATLRHSNQGSQYTSEQLITSSFFKAAAAPLDHRLHQPYGV